VVDRIRAIGADEGLVTETLKAARALHGVETKRLEDERPAGEKDLGRLNDEVRPLLGEGKPSAARLADLEERVRSAERRLTEVRELVVATEREAIDSDDLEAALSTFDGTWDALYPREQARVTRLLVERVCFDGGQGTLALTLRPTGIQTLAREMGTGPKEVGR
jgi:site-specific DNA recombinase